jgi:hypothetical protein
MAGSGTNTLGILILVAGLGMVIYLLVGDNIARYARPAVNRVQSQAPGWFNWKTAIPLGIAIGLALLMRVPLISAYIVLIGLLTLWNAYNKAKIAEIAKMNKQVSRLVFAFRNVYKIQPVVFAALREVLSRLDQPLKGWIDATLQAYRVTSSEEEAFAILRSKTKNHYLNQFLYVLEMSGSASEETVIAALDNLAQRLRRYADLQRETEIELSSITSQTRIIQVIGVAVLFVIAAVPTLRGVYARIYGAQLIYIILITIAAGTSYIIDWRVSKLRENVL